MSNLKALRTRIKTIANTRKVTRAMQLVATARLRGVRQRAEQARPFAKKLERVIATLGWLVSDMPEASKLLVGTGREQTFLCIVVTSERGLCGALNANIVRHVREHVAHFENDGKKVKLLCVGRRGERLLRARHGHLIEDVISLRDVRQVRFSNARQIASKVLDLYAEGAFDVCCVFYAKGENALFQEPRSTQLIPAVYASVMTYDEMCRANARAASISFEPDEQTVLNDLLARNISAQIYRALLESAASEQAARMTAMGMATRNAGRLIDALTLEYNHTRQAQITDELMEIVAGVEALR